MKRTGNPLLKQQDSRAGFFIAWFSETLKKLKMGYIGARRPGLHQATTDMTTALFCAHMLDMIHATYRYNTPSELFAA